MTGHNEHSILPTDGGKPLMTSSDSGPTWHGAGWSVRLDPSKPLSPVALDLDRAHWSPEAASNIAVALADAAYQAYPDDPAYSGLPPIPATPSKVAGLEAPFDVTVGTGEVEGTSHGLLIATLLSLGGSVDLTADQLGADAMGDAEGRFYGLAMIPAGDGKVRLTVVAQSSDQQG